MDVNHPVLSEIGKIIDDVFGPLTGGHAPTHVLKGIMFSTAQYDKVVVYVSGVDLNPIAIGEKYKRLSDVSFEVTIDSIRIMKWRNSEAFGIRNTDLPKYSFSPADPDYFSKMRSTIELIFSAFRSHSMLGD
jgi:hypothetical protein